MRHLIREAGLGAAIEVDSAGTAGYHTGDAPDPRACAAGQRCGIEIGGKARQFRRRDFDEFDYVIAMDASNLEHLQSMAPASSLDKIALLRSFDASSPPNSPVPDPYYGDEAGFDEVLALCRTACAGLLEHIRKEHGL